MEKEKEMKLAVRQNGRLLGAEERHIIEEDVRYSVNCGFGDFHEDEALDEYEKRTGNPVGERNTELREWKFDEDDPGGVGGGGTLFSCIGVADGISAELSEISCQEGEGGEDGRGGEASFAPVIVECKHRMNPRYFGKNAGEQNERTVSKAPLLCLLC